MRHRVVVSQWMLVDFAVMVEADNSEAAENEAIDRAKNFLIEARRLFNVRQAGEIMSAKASVVE